MQFADFVSCGFNQIINNLAKLHYRWAEKADVVVRMPCGAGVAAGPFHSQSNEAWFYHTPGLKVVYPSSPEDAKGLLIASIEDPNPVIFLENEVLYGQSFEVPTDPDLTIPIGKANIVSRGTDVTIVTFSIMVGKALEAASQLAEEGVDAEVIDLRTIRPLDEEAIIESVAKTNRIIVVEEGWPTCGIGSEVAALMMEKAFDFLDAPLLRVCGEDVPMPYAANLETLALPQVADIVDAAKKVCYRG